MMIMVTFLLAATRDQVHCSFHWLVPVLIISSSLLVITPQSLPTESHIRARTVDSSSRAILKGSEGGLVS